MLPSSQQKQFEVPPFREPIVTARLAMGPAELTRENAPLSLNTSLNIQLADRPLRRLAPSTARENAGASASVRHYNGRQHADRRDPSGGDSGRGTPRQPRRGIRLRVREPQA